MVGYYSIYHSKIETIETAHHHWIYQQSLNAAIYPLLSSSFSLSISLL